MVSVGDPAGEVRYGIRLGVGAVSGTARREGGLSVNLCCYVLTQLTLARVDTFTEL